MSRQAQPAAALTCGGTESVDGFTTIDPAPIDCVRTSFTRGVTTFGQLEDGYPAAVRTRDMKESHGSAGAAAGTTGHAVEDDPSSGLWGGQLPGQRTAEGQGGG